MGSLARSLLILFVLSCSICAQETEQKGGSATVTGRITVGNKPAPNITVVAAQAEFSPQRREAARATTDYEGNYRLMNLAAGRYSVTPLAPAMVIPGDNMYGSAGRFVIVSEGEMIEKIDFSITRGGVITGRITDSDGKPVIEERVQLTPADNTNPGRFFMLNPFMLQTDDRGIYRIYGIPPGRYTLSVGVASQDGMVRVGPVSRGYFERTFYPGETDIKKATIIEVTEGGEAKEINIKLGRRSQTFIVSGRVVDAETGSPVPNVVIGYGSYSPAEKQITSYGFGQSRTNARGQFTLEGVVPGRFAAFTMVEAETYAEPAPFEVRDADVGGLEVKVRRGATLTGVTQIEGTTDKAVMARLQQLSIGISVQSPTLGPPGSRPATINPDGSFRLTGLPPGRASLYLHVYPQPKDLRLVRVERDGVAQPNGIEITPGADIRNVRVIFEYGGGSIRGQVTVENGQLPEGSRMFVFINKPDDQANAQPVSYSQADTRGRFLIEGLPTGEYIIVINAQFPPGAGRAPRSVKQNVTVANGMETEARMVLDLSPTEGEGKDQ